MYQTLDDKRHIKLTEDKMKHCMEVANYMYDYAVYFDIDPDIAYFTGLNHDIGYINGRVNHGENGAEFLGNLGLAHDITYAIQNHGKNPYDIDKNSITGLMQLLWCADMSVDKYGKRVGFDKRLLDIKKRYGEDSIAYETAKNTVDYCKNIINYKTTILNELGVNLFRDSRYLKVDFDRLIKFDKNPVDGSKNFTFKMDTKNYPPVKEFEHPIKERILLHHFGIDYNFLKKYHLPVPEPVFVFKLNDNGTVADMQLRLDRFKQTHNHIDSNEISIKDFYADLKRFSASISENMSKKYLAKMLNLSLEELKEKPYEFFDELNKSADLIVLGMYGKNPFSHDEFIKEAFEDDFKKYLKTLELEKEEQEIER